jgi:hypothetical protein
MSSYFLAYEALPMTRDDLNGCLQRMQMETIMLADLALEPITLRSRSVHRIEHAKGLQVTCVRGVIWVTQEHDSRDLVLTAGQSVVLDRRGLAVVFAFKDAVITVGTGSALPAAAPLAPRRTYADRAWA